VSGIRPLVQLLLLLSPLLLLACSTPAQKPVETYLLFFEPQSEAVNALARGVVAKAASDAQAQRNGRLTVTGYSDRRGDHVANLALSKRRAEAVAKLLADAGLPRERITADGRGEDQSTEEATYGRRVVIQRFAE
jgi:outer membrane protein OmpA-like peptidoglycan-associated protein